MTAAQKTDMYRFFSIAFNAAPGVTYMAQLDTAVASGMTTQAIVNVFSEKAEFTTTYPTTDDNATFAAKLVEGIVGTSASFAAKVEAVNDVKGALAIGMTRGDVVFKIFGNLAGLTADATWGATAAMMNNKVAVAAYYTETLATDSTDLAALRTVLAHVAATTDVSTPAAMAAAMVAPGVAPTAQTFTLTAATNNFALTTGNDTVIGVSATLAAADVVIDSTTTDADVLTAQVTVATLAPTIVKVETLNINGDFVTTGLDLSNVVGAKTVNLNTGIISGTATLGLAAGTTKGGVKTTVVEKIAFGGNVVTAVIHSDDTGTGGQVKIDSGSVTDLTFNAVTPTAPDSYALTTNNANLKLNTLVNVEAIVITPTVAGKKITVTDVQTLSNTIDFANSVNATLAGTAAFLDGRIVTKSGTANLTVDVTAFGPVNLTKTAATDVTLSAASAALVTVKSGMVVSTGIDQGTGFILAAPASSATTNAVTFASTAAVQAVITGQTVKTLTVVSSAPAIAGVDATYTSLVNGTDKIVLSGTNDVKVTAGTAASVDASSLIGFLDYTQTAAAATSVKGGSGANLIALKAVTVDVTYVGQNGGDGVTLLNTTGNANITTGTGNDTITVNALTTGAMSITTGAGNDTVSATGLTTGVISANLGAGDDTFTIGGTAATTVVVSIDGGDGTDLLNITKGSDFKGGVFSVSNVETIAITGGGALTFSAAQLSGKTYSFSATANVADELKVTGVASSTTIDLSGVTTDKSTTAGVTKGTTINATASTSAVTITGTNQIDTITVSANGSNVTAGAGMDDVTFGAGADKMIYKAISGATLMAEAGSAASGATGTAPTALGDKVTTFTSGTDKIVLSVAFGTAGASGGLVGASGTSYVAGATALTAADFVDSSAMIANIAGGGRFVWTALSGVLVYDANGDSVSTTSGQADDFIVATIGTAPLVASDFLFA